MPSLKARLLIVDDDAAITSTLDAIFSQLGHPVRTASDGISALQKIRTQVPDILLSDLNMPQMCGFELLSVIRRRLPEVFVIASSAAFSGEEIPAGLAADAFHEKSTGLERLFELVKTATHKGQVRSGSSASTPIWISRMKEEKSSDRLPITCPECMRAFSLCVAASDFVIEEARCVYCHATIQYGLVPRMKSAMPRQPDGARTISRASSLDESCGLG
jgi:CheY-like chemotaxis protein